MKKWSLGISSQFFFAFLIAALIPLGLTWYLARQQTVSDAEALAQLTLQLESEKLLGGVNAWLYVNEQSLIENAAMPAMRSMRPEQQKLVLVRMTQLQPWIFVAYSLGLDGLSLTRSDGLAPINFADRDYFKAVTKDGKPFAQQVLIGRAIGKPAWTSAVPIQDDGGNVIGALAKTTGLEDLTAELLKTKIGRTGKAMLLSPDGKLIAVSGAPLSKELKDFTQHPVYKAALAGQEEARFEEAGQKVFARIRKSRLNWVVAVQLDEEEAFERVRSTDRFMASLLGFAVLVAAAFALLFAPTIARPIKRLTAIAEEISRGNFDHSVGETKRGDEIGALARAIERMTKSLRIAMSNLSQRR